MVEDAEQLFRRVANVSGMYVETGDGLRLSSSAFNDAGRQPSVDRALLRDGDPNRSKTSATQGIAMLLTREVRAIAEVVQRDSRGGTRFVYTIDVIASPIEPDNEAHPDYNPAHALIVSAPAFESEGTFKRLKECLARLASQHGWLVRPS